jgi:thioredoxin-like negative regulator of GroEL
MIQKGLISYSFIKTFRNEEKAPLEGGFYGDTLPQLDSDPVKSEQVSEAQPHEQSEHTSADDRAGAETSQSHRQKSSQQPSSERIETAPHDSRVVREPPSDVFESPEAKSADHIPKPLPSDEVSVKQTPLKAASPKSDLELAWQRYNQGRYEAAAKLFDAVIDKDRRQAMNARLGLAYSRLRQGQREAAVVHLKHMVQQRYRLAETLPLLLTQLQEEGDFETAGSYLHLLPPKVQRRWTRKLLEDRAIADYRTLQQEKEPTHLEWVKFLDRHRPALDLCIRPDLFFEAATQLQAHQDDTRAIALYNALGKCDLPPDLRIGVLSRLSILLAPDAAVDLISQEKPWFRGAEPQLLDEIDRLEILAIKRKLNSLPESAVAERRSAAEAILALAPRDQDALALLAWSEFELHNYRQSTLLFEQLLKQEPHNRDYALGLGYSQFNLGNLEGALEPLDRSEISDDDKTLQLRSLVYKARARRAYDNRDWHSAAENLEAALRIDPMDANSKELLAWTRLQQQRTQDALALMEEVYAQKQDPVAAGSMLDMYRSADETARGWQLAKEMVALQDPQSLQKAADFFFTQGAPVSAAQVDPDARRCYTGADAPRIDTFLYHRNRSGDDGTSKLAETAFPVTMVYPIALGNTLSLSLTPRYLSSGKAPDTPFAGRFYRSLNGEPQLNDLDDGLFVWQPDVGFKREGHVNIAAHIGTSPIGGAVSPTPTLALRFSTSRWYADLHRCTVKDSILSYTGLEDPYSSSKWGRVTRNGISAGITWTLFEDYWLNAAVGYNFYSGENLWDNDSYHFYTAAGRTFDHKGNELTLGLFFTAQHYRRNSDFYTYGHGGYYSPELMTIVGPLFRYRTALCRTYWFDLQVSAGWFYQKLDDSPYYPLFEGDVTGFTPVAAANALGQYPGDTDNKLNLSARIQGMKLISNQIAVGGFAGVNNDSDYTTWQVGVGLQFFFDLQNLFWERRDFFSDFGDCSNR